MRKFQIKYKEELLKVSYLLFCLSEVSQGSMIEVIRNYIFHGLSSVIGFNIISPWKDIKGLQRKLYQYNKLLALYSLEISRILDFHPYLSTIQECFLRFPTKKFCSLLSEF
jgi:hypothetical protein